MPISPLSQLLVTDLEGTSVLAGRYEKIKWINTTKGCFSLVFRAFDRLTNQEVALKFFDIDPAKMMDTYRVAAFMREEVLLANIRGKKRCVQLVDVMHSHTLNVSTSHGVTIPYPCSYFVIEWIQDEIEDVFDAQDKHDAISKLQLFHDITLSVEALHRYGLYHRDLKPDNLRATHRNGTKLVVAIDLGAAARSDSTVLGGSYNSSVGSPAYAAPEAFCGLAADRSIAPLTDMYALGCMLYELFNIDLFAEQLLQRNLNYMVLMAALRGAVLKEPTIELKTAAWRREIKRLARGVMPVPIDAPGSTCPKAVVNQLDELLTRMTRFDVNRRETSLETVRAKILAAIRVLKNSKLMIQRLEQARLYRANRIKVLQHRHQRMLGCKAQNVNR